MKRANVPAEEVNNTKLSSEHKKGKGRNRGRRNDYERASSSEFKPGNDFAWWSKVPELLKDAANLKSNYIPGTPLDPLTAPVRMPGAMVIHFEMVYGVSRTATDPLNVWARDLYLRMFQKYRGISSYSASDLGITLIAAIEVVRMIAKLERIYGVINRYSKLNLNLPFTEQAALGLTVAQADAIRKDLANYRFDLNELIRKAQRLCIPKDIAAIADQLSLLGCEYLDHDNAKAQIIIFDSDYFGVYSDTLVSTGGCITYAQATMASTTRLIDMTNTTNVFPFLSNQLDQLLGSTSVQRIFGDLVTWFGEAQLLSILPLPEDYTVMPVFSESILHKMHNLEAIGNGSSFRVDAAYPGGMTTADLTAVQATHRSIVQYMDNIISSPVIRHNTLATTWYTHSDGFQYPFQATNGYGQISRNPVHILDTYRVDADVETITEGVLFKRQQENITATIGGSSYSCDVVTSCAFEIISNMILYTPDPSNATLLVSTSVQYGTYQSPTAAAQAAGYLAVLDWAPLCYDCNLATSNVAGVYGDIDNPVMVNAGALSKLHRAIVYSGIQTDVVVVNK